MEHKEDPWSSAQALSFLGGKGHVGESAATGGAPTRFKRVCPENGCNRVAKSSPTTTVISRKRFKTEPEPVLCSTHSKQRGRRAEGLCRTCKL